MIWNEWATLSIIEAWTDADEAEETMENAADSEATEGAHKSGVEEESRSEAASRDMHVWRGSDVGVETIPTTLMGDSAGMAYRCANDFSWTMRALSEEVRRVTGYEAGELLGNREVAFGDLISPSDRTTVWYRVQRAIESGEAFDFSYRIEQKDGGIVRVREEGQGVYRDGHLIAVEGWIRLETRDKLDLVTAPADGE